MIERQEINGRPATVAYFTRAWEPAAREKAELVKIRFDDGAMLILTRPFELEDAEKAYDPNQPREPAGSPTGGRWVSAGGGGGAGEDSMEAADRENLEAIQRYAPPWQTVPEDFEAWASYELEWAQQRIDTYMGRAYPEHRIEESCSTKITPEHRLVFAGLTSVEAAHITSYSMSTFWDLNLGLRSGALDGALEYHASVLDRALGKLPAFAGRVVRGANLPDSIVDSYRSMVGKIITERGFLSTTSDGRQRFKGNTKFTIKSKTGRDIGMLSHALRQKEVLFRRGTSFRVISVKPSKLRSYKYEIILEEV